MMKRRKIISRPRTASKCIPSSIARLQTSSWLLVGFLRRLERETFFSKARRHRILVWHCYGRRETQIPTSLKAFANTWDSNSFAHHTQSCALWNPGAMLSPSNSRCPRSEAVRPLSGMEEWLVWVENSLELFLEAGSSSGRGQQTFS